MNIENFKPINNLNWNKIFKMQKQIFLNFMQIENKEFKLNNFDINTLEDQKLFKNFMFRIIEELTEASLDIENENHAKEELIDALNFLINTYIVYGFNYKNLKNIKLEINKFFNYYSIIEKIGECTNLLKNREWKQSQYLIDLFIFEKVFKEIWIYFLHLFNILNINEQEIFKIWSLKYQVNLFRLRTKY